MQEPHGVTVGDCCAKHDEEDENGRRLVQTQPRFLKGWLALIQD